MSATFFEHITDQNPDAAVQLCQQYNLDVQNADEAPDGLYAIVDQGGEQGLRDVLSLHPEKDMIIDLFGEKSEICQGDKCIGCKNNKMLIQTNQADGGKSAMQAQTPPSNSHQLSVMLQTNTLLVIGIVSFVLIGTVIILKQKGN